MIFVLLVVVVLLAVLLYRRSQQQKRPAAPPTDPLRRDARGIDPRRLGVGDIVNHAGRDWVVRGTIEFDQDGFRWHEHLLDDASTRRWLSVEDNEELEIVLWEAATAPELEPGGQRVEHAGTEYTLDEHGRATFRAAGSTGTAPTGEVEYWDYTAGARRLSFERYGTGSWEVGVGTVLNENELDIYPASRG